MCLLQVVEESNELLYQESGFLYVVFLVHQMAKDKLVASKSTMINGEKGSAVQDSDKTMVYHALHYLTKATSQADPSVTSC
jgi:hypothetical protein